MLFKTYELRPAFSYLADPDPDFYGQAVGKSSSGNSYSIIVGTTKQAPTSRDREKIESAIRKAWEELFDPQGLEPIYRRKFFAPPYGLAVIYDQSPPLGETGPPQFLYNAFYIVFALFESETPVSEDEERASHESIWQAITAQYDHTEPKPRIGLVTLYNCTVQLLEGPGPTDGREKTVPGLPRGRGFRR